MAQSAKTPGDILLEAGTNELEVLLFRVGECLCGVNVAKVREVIRPVEVTKSPNMHPSVHGMFNVRGTLMPLVDLARHLGLNEQTRAPGVEGRVVITEFNGLMTGFEVDSVEQIYRISWKDVRPAPSLEGLGREQKFDASAITGIIEIKERLVLMIDFESIADAILMEERLHIESVANPHQIDRGQYRVLLAEDSNFMRLRMEQVLRASGYTQLETFTNGRDLLETVERSLEDGTQPISAIISDIEMPQIDGLHVTHRLKTSPQFRHIPVLLFSSLISSDNLKKGEQVGADAQMAKPELSEVVLLVDKLVSGKADELRAAA